MNTESLPEYPPDTVPDQLATLRKLRTLGLRPGDDGPVAELTWRGATWAGLYDLATCEPTGHYSTAQALRAHHICQLCGMDTGDRISPTLGTCHSCIVRTR